MMDGSKRKRVRMFPARFVKFVNVLINFKRGEKLRFAFIDRRKLHLCIHSLSLSLSLCKTRLAYKTGDLSLSRFSNELLDLISTVETPGWRNFRGKLSTYLSIIISHQVRVR